MAKKQVLPEINKDGVLALDIATHCGFYSTHSSGTWNFTETKKRNNNKKHWHFRETLIEYIKDNNITHIVAEDVLMNKNRFRATVSLSEMRGILLEVCDTLDLPNPEFLNAITIKKFATGNGKATKEQMIEAAERDFNFVTASDDEADAFFIFTLYCRKKKLH